MPLSWQFVCVYCVLILIYYRVIVHECSLWWMWSVRSTLHITRFLGTFYRTWSILTTDRTGPFTCASELKVGPRLTADLITHYFAASSGAKYCNQSVCLSVFPLTYLKNHTFKFHSVHVTSRRGSVILWRQCSKLCTSGFVDDIMFLYNGVNGPESKTTRIFVQFTRWRHWGEVCRLRLHFVNICSLLRKQDRLCLKKRHCFGLL